MYVVYTLHMCKTYFMLPLYNFQLKNREISEIGKGVRQMGVRSKVGKILLLRSLLKNSKMLGSFLPYNETFFLALYMKPYKKSKS